VISRIYTGLLIHTRTQPIRRSFSYPTYMLGLDLADLQDLQLTLPLFGYNRRRLCSIWDQDYLDPKGGSIVNKLRQLLARAGHTGEVATMYLLTMPRILRMGFNPINIVWCFGSSGSTSAVVVEVRNTYREVQPYVLQAPQLISSVHGGGSRYRFPKQLFVSPFNGVEGVYDLRLGMPGEDLRVDIDLVCAGDPVVRAAMSLRGTPLTHAALARTLWRYPLTAAASLPRIVFQAAVLRVTKGMKPRLKPRPASSMAIHLTGTESRWFHRRTAKESLK
jgi:cyclopropane-fatty-acyl-phospholipid synthase